MRWLGPIAFAMLLGWASPGAAQDGGQRDEGADARDAGVARRTPRTTPRATPQDDVSAGRAPTAPPRRPTRRRAEPTPTSGDDAPQTPSTLIEDGGVPDAGPAQSEPSEAEPTESDAGTPDIEAASADSEASEAEPPDAGAPDAGSPGEDAGHTEATVSREEDDDDSLLGVVEALLFERAERAEMEAARARDELARRERPDGAGQTGPQQEAAPAPIDVRVVGCGPAAESIGLSLPERQLSTLGLILLLFVTLLGLAVIDRVRRPLPEQGLLPRVLGAAHLALRLAAVVMVLNVASRLLPGWLAPFLLIGVIAAALAIGIGAVWPWLPDVVGGVLLLAERRVRAGLWLIGDGFAGQIERVGPRVTTLRAADGSLFTIPNRQLVSRTVHTSAQRFAETKVALEVPDAPATEVRAAIRDAVLCSPYVPSHPLLAIARDASQPRRWTVTVRLLDARFGRDFEGQLLERVEEALAPRAETPAPEPPPQPPEPPQ